MKRRIPLGITLTLVIIATSVSFVVTAFTLHRKYNSVVNSFSERSLQYEYLAEVDSIVRNNYYGDIEEDSVKISVSSGYVSGLNDTDCMFLSAEEYTSYKKIMNGYNSGCGLKCKYSADSNAICVESVSDGSPADSSDIKSGDLITAVDGEVVTSENAQALLKKIEGEGSGKIKLTLSEGNKTVSVGFGYTEVPVTYSKKSGVGYIRVSGIFDGTSELFGSALEYFTDKSVSKIIIDLRNNSSYNYDEAANMIDMLVPVAGSGNKAIAIIGDKDGNSVKAYDSDADCYLFTSVAVLVNDRTVGAAELIATDLAQFGKADIYGEQTAGDGKVVSVFELSDGNALVLTTGLVTPYIGSSFDEKGIMPDTEIKMTDTEKNTLSEIICTKKDSVYTQVMSVLSGE